MQNTPTSLRRQFLKKWLKISAYSFFGLWLFLAWAFQSDYAPSALWALFFTSFVCGGGMFLRWADGYSDIEILLMAQQKERAE